jgi:beta-glucosidase
VQKKLLENKALRRFRPALPRLALAGVGALLAIGGPLGGGAASARQARAAAAKHGRTAPSTCPWLDSSLPVAKRVNMLLSAMSLSDKISEMYINEPTTTGPYAGYEGYVAAQPQLCIPALIEEDGSQGVAYGAPGVTQLPAEVSLASAWDPTLAYQYGVVNGQEHRAKGIAVVLGPSVNIQRDPRWGRNFEMFSEDPLLTSVLGDANIEGLQSQGVMADVKHFVTYNQETNRGTPNDNTIVNTRALHEIYLPPFETAITQAHAASVMCAYPLLNGDYSCANPSLLTGLLDERWGFPGFVRSDSGANPSTVDSANAGLDQERGSFFWDNGSLAAAVADGEVRGTTINEAVRRILTEMFQFNLFNDPLTGGLSSPAATPANNAVAQNVAERGTVLLQNNGPILPLNAATTKSIAVIGADGTTAPQTAGSGSSYVTPSSVISPLQGITARLGSAGTVSSYSGTDPGQAAATAAQAQVAIVFASYPEGEGSDLTSIELPGTQDQMIEAVAAANPNTIVVLNTGGPVLMPWLTGVKGVIEAWYPGQDDGSAIASVLFGDTDPSGHLPETFPTSLAAIPTAAANQFPGVGGRVDYSEGLDVGYRWYDANNVTPLFPFGYGLSYTTFGFTNLKVTPANVDNSTSGPDATVGQSAPLARVSATITNTGSVPGSDVAQLYVGDPAVAGEPPRQLEGFKRVTLNPGASQTVTFTITGHELSYFDTGADGWTLPDGRFSLYVGDSSALNSLPLHGKLNVKQTIGRRYTRLSAPTLVNPAQTFTATARFVNDGDLPIIDGTVRMAFPASWTVVRLAKTPTLTLAPGHSATRHWRVTVPESAEGEVKALTASLTSGGADDAGDLSSTVTISVQGPVAVTAGSPVVILSSATAGTASVTVTSHMDKAVTVSLNPSLPPGVSVTPAAPSILVPARKTVTLKFSVAVAAGTGAGSEQMPLRPSFTYLGHPYPLAAAALAVYVAYPSLAAAFNDSAISDDFNVDAANFDGNGNSYSAQALSAAGLQPGANVTVGPTTLQWPDVPSGTADSVLAAGQTIAMTGAPAGATQLALLGASSGADETGTLMVEYTDGTQQSFSVSLDDWFNFPDSPFDNTVATTSYINDSTGAGVNGAVGKRNHPARVFSVAVTLAPGKTVASVTLPNVATLPGVYPMHIFALGVGGAPGS